MSLSADDPRPASQQVADAIRAEIRSGELAPGAKLPSVRDLAKRYTVAPMTAQSAVEILRGEGLVYTSPGRGSFVREQAEAPEPEHSPEYLAIKQHLDALDATVRDLSARLAELEEQAKQAAP
ncbi:GntR family transcriptional regulator [Streptacidiphilus sp. ASG 303]|uniref:GntR family transcriptional regulator n=1 Tax=Streptacidiphilus sp. ASG 303 TaxID=2896847 RepID=UPI001E63D460|nr:GntR family transcriptional regulator [Streptacidiphilus sp. ASG 303]MCD0485625.1 GntR family transcriptional regulator [Streptacidiphilus sp. ASG 303]